MESRLVCSPGREVPSSGGRLQTELLDYGPSSRISPLGYPPAPGDATPASRSFAGARAHRQDGPTTGSPGTTARRSRDHDQVVVSSSDHPKARGIGGPEPVRCGGVADAHRAGWLPPLHPLDETLSFKDPNRHLRRVFAASRSKARAHKSACLSGALAGPRGLADVDASFSDAVVLPWADCTSGH